MAELAAIQDLGIKLLVDDFGTGYSSLSQLKTLKLDVMKVDRTFTTQLDEGENQEIFFQAMMTMAKSLNMRAVAEGVETVEQLHVLRRLGCEEIQGYLASPPVAPDVMATMLQKRFLLPKPMHIIPGQAEQRPPSTNTNSRTKLVHEEQFSPSSSGILETYDPARVRDALIFHLQLKNDSALAKLLGIRPQRVSKIRRRVNPVSAALLIRMSEITNFSVNDLRRLLSDRRTKHRIGPNHFWPKEGGGHYLAGESDGEGLNG